MVEYNIVVVGSEDRIQKLLRVLVPGAEINGLYTSAFASAMHEIASKYIVKQITPIAGSGGVTKELYVIVEDVT